MKEMLRSSGGILRCRDRARRKLVRLMDARVSRVECAEMQHNGVIEGMVLGSGLSSVAEGAGMYQESECKVENEEGSQGFDVR